MEKEGKLKAVALKYDKKSNPAPYIVAKGQGNVAQNIIDLAKKHNVALYKDPELVNTLACLDIGTEIPPELYKAVAKILFFIYDLDLKLEEERSHD